jgi:predicted nucleic acid-binding protein
LKVAFDSTFLALLFNRNSRASVANAADLVDELLDSLNTQKAKIIIPAPSLTEILLKATKSGTLYLEKLKEFSCFQIKPFDEKSAVELASIFVSSIGKRRKKKDVEKTKVTFDRQIVAIAKVHGAQQMYSDDEEVRLLAKECGLDAFGFADLKTSPKQTKLNLTGDVNLDDSRLSSFSTEPPPPSAQSATFEPEKASQLAPDHPSDHQDDPKKPQPDSSPALQTQQSKPPAD